MITRWYGSYHLNQPRTGPGPPGCTGGGPGPLSGGFWWDVVRFKWVIRILLSKESSFTKDPFKPLRGLEVPDACLRGAQKGVPSPSSFPSLVKG